MTPINVPGTGWVRYAAVVALVAVPAVAAGCAGQSATDDASAAGGGDAAESTAPTADAGDAAASPAGAAVIDRACPQDLTAQDLRRPVDYGSADVDGDGDTDTITLGTVAAGGAGCSAALVVTTAGGTAATALPDLEIVPPSAFVPGGAATVGGTSVIAAPISFSPRGGGEVGLFTLVDGVLTPVHDDSGDVWSIVATVDDGGGLPQSIDCTAGGLTWGQVSTDGLGGAVHEREVRFRLDGTRLVRTSASVERGDATVTAGLGNGLSIFASC